MTNLITEARELLSQAKTYIDATDGRRLDHLLKDGYDARYAELVCFSVAHLSELCDALEKAEERGQGCEHCRGWDKRCGANYCPMCGKKLPVYAGTIGGEIVQHALKELVAQEGAEHERD